LVNIEGIVEEIIFSNELNGYTVCDVKCNEDTITAVGCMPFINVGEFIKLTGNWVNHQDYGQQLKVEGYEKLLPKTTDSIERYLASGILKGVGPATASKIIEKFGDDSLNIIHCNPEKLSHIKGISLEKAMKIGQAYEEQQGLRNVVMFLQEYGISAVYSSKIYKAFGEKTIEEIKSNPYRLADEIFGIGFKNTDKIAKSMGINPNSKYRICSGIKYVLSQSAASGHTYVPDDKLKEYTSQLLEVNIDSINDAIISLVMDKSICIEKSEGFTNVYLSSFFNAELGVCKRLFELASICHDEDLKGFEEMIEKIQIEEGLLLAEKQKTAVREALINGLLVITGGPGTGKTTIIKSILKLLDKGGYEVALAAPTGRAAKRMSEATGYESKTIHRLLEIGYLSSETEIVFAKNESNPIEADVIIIDEMSMVDILLMNNLLKAVAVGTRLILVGDVDQLPSVGPGNVLKDIITSKIIKTVKLNEIFRQAEESMIIVNAHKVNRGEFPHLNKKDKDFFFMSRWNGADIVKTIVELVSKRLPLTYGYDPMKSIQVLTPTKKGSIGVANLNIELQKALNPKRSGKNEKIFRDSIFREGDRVMQTKNNYNLRWEKHKEAGIEGEGVFNGDTGVIQKVSSENSTVTVLFEDEKVAVYDYTILDEIEPAYAITIHKSQGSEFPVIIIPLFTGPQILMSRNLLYTAITRAKELVILVGMESVVNEMINNKKESLRYSGLKDKLKSCLLRNATFQE